VRAVVQRVTRARVTTEAEPASEIGPGLLILLGVGRQDSEEHVRHLASRVARLRIFDDDGGRMNRSLLDVHGQALVVSQFTLYGNTSRGLRPSFTEACAPERARALYEQFASELSYLGVPTRRGWFGARMTVELVNDGPVTLLLEEPTERRPAES
jgi:D-tyrosyl-tRNA(Tyr) deacylase